MSSTPNRLFIVGAALFIVIVVIFGGTFALPDIAASVTEIEPLEQNDMQIIESSSVDEFLLYPGDEIGSVQVVTTITYDNGQKDEIFSSAISPIYVTERAQSFVSPDGCCAVTEVEYRYIINTPPNLKIQTIDVDGEILFCNEKDDPDLNCIDESTNRPYNNACDSALNCDFQFDNATPFLKFNPNSIPFINEGTQFVFESRLTILVFNEDDGKFYTAINDNFNMRVYIPFAQQTSLNVDVEDGSSNENDFVVINGQAYDNETEEVIGKGCALGCDVGDDSLIPCSTVDTGECQSVIKPVEAKEYLYTTGFNNDVDMCHYTFVGDTSQRVAPC